MTGAVRAVDVAERRSRLARRHYLAIPAPDVVEVATGLGGLHASDPATVYLAAWTRVDGFTTNHLEAALYDDRTLLRVLGMRRTMFVVPPDMAAAMDVACTATYREREWKRITTLLADQGVSDDPAAWLRSVAEATVAALDARGEATAMELREDVPELATTLTFGEGTKWAGSVGMSTRVLFLLATDGRIVRGRPLGSWLSSQYRWALTDRWLGRPLADLTTEAAERDIATRWLWAFGPGTEKDLQWWTGWGVRQTRRVLADVGAVTVATDGGPAHLLADDVEPVDESKSWVALVPALDPTTMGWKHRDWYLGEHAPLLFDRNGNAGPTVWTDGRVVGGWAQRSDGTIAVRLLEDVGRENIHGIEDAAHRLETWLGDHRIKPRFRTPIERELSA